MKFPETTRNHSTYKYMYEISNIVSKNWVKMSKLGTKVRNLGTNVRN